MHVPELCSIERKRLDFDFEKICCVTLSPVNVYACLTCGKFLQGRSQNSPAHQHCLSEGHLLYINLDTKKVFVLPENEELDDPQLEDIRVSDTSVLDRNVLEGIDLHGRKYTAGFIGLNNIKANDYANVSLHALLHITPIRDLFLSVDFCNSPSVLLQNLSSAARRIWNPKPFKALLSPHEFMQAVNLASDRRYSINKQAEVLEFMAWLLNTVGRDLVIHHSIGLVTQSLQGRVQVSTKQLRPKDMTVMLDATFQSKTIPFYYLSLDLPPVPLYQSSSGEFAVPQVPLEQILSKYDGGQLSQRGDLLQAFSLEELPEYLILHYKRFVKAHLIWEKNRTIVSHPLTRLPVLDSKKDVHHYDIVANICHRGEVEKGHFFIQLLHPATGHWYEIDDLMVRQMPAVNIPLSESYLQIWRRHEN